MEQTPEREAPRTPDAAVGAAGMRIVRLLVGQPPQTIASLIAASGVTRTAITEQLNELVESGFVERTTERLSGRGRPRHLYAATNDALLLLLSTSQRLVVPAIWAAIDQIGGEILARKVLRRVGQILGKHYKEQVAGKTPRQRLVEMGRILREEGALVDIDEDDAGRVMMHRRSCPFSILSDESRTVCCLDEEMMKVVVGRRVRRTAWRYDGASCCVFKIASSNGK